MINNRKLFLLLTLSVIACGGDLVQALDRSFTTTTVGNTNAEGTIYSYTIPAGTMANARCVRMIIWGTYLNNTGANRTLTVRLKLGGTTILTKASGAIATSATTVFFWGSFQITNNNATANQRAGLNFQWERGGTDISPIIETGAATIDTTVDQLMEVTVQHSATSAALTLSKTGAVTLLY
jgi:hypothetical protein